MKQATIIGAVLIVAFLIYRAAQPEWHVVSVTEGTSKKDLLLINLYAPFTRAGLLDDPESTYGPPSDTGSEGKKPHYVFFDEYIGKHGRIRVYDEAYPDEDGWQQSNWLELYSNTLYLTDVIRPEFLKDFAGSDDEWKVMFQPANRSWHFVITGEGYVIKKIYDN